MLRWMTDIFLGAAVSYFMQQKKQTNHGVALKMSFVLLRRALFMAISAFVTASLAMGAVFITLIDLGNFINMFGAAGLTAVGQLGLGLFIIASGVLFFIIKKPLELKPEESVILESISSPSIVETIAVGLLEYFGNKRQRREHAMQAEVRSASHYEPELGVADPAARDRSWSAYTN